MKLKNALKNMEKNNDFFNLISEYIYIKNKYLYI